MAKQNYDCDSEHVYFLNEDLTLWTTAWVLTKTEHYRNKMFDMTLSIKNPGLRRNDDLEVM